MSTVAAHPSLIGLLPPADRRYPTFNYVLTWMDDNLRHHPGSVIIETGTARDGARNCGGDGCSSVIFDRYVRSFTEDEGPEFYSVDINSAAIANARFAVIPPHPRTTFVVSDSVQFLDRFTKQIDVLYLDSYDFDGNNPGPSQQHHLREIEVALKRLKPTSLVLLDDCQLVHGGKCTLVEAYLRRNGYEAVLEAYQKVFRFNGVKSVLPRIEMVSRSQCLEEAKKHTYHEAKAYLLRCLGGQR